MINATNSSALQRSAAVALACVLIVGGSAGTAAAKEAAPEVAPVGADAAALPLDAEEAATGVEAAGAGIEAEAAGVESVEATAAALPAVAALAAKGAEATAGRAPSDVFLKFPLNQMYITSNFGMRYHPTLHYRRMHAGTDFRAPCGTDILAAQDGSVLSARWEGSGGNTVVIDHGQIGENNIKTRYLHLSKILVGAGNPVQQGDVIGRSGMTGGISTGCHLHLEVLIDDEAVNPVTQLPYIEPPVVDEEPAEFTEAKPEGTKPEEAAPEEAAPELAKSKKPAATAKAKEAPAPDSAKPKAKAPETSASTEADGAAAPANDAPDPTGDGGPASDAAAPAKG